MQRHDQKNAVQDVVIDASERQKREIAEVLHGRIQTRLLVASYRLGQCRSLVATNPREAMRLLGQVRREIDDIREHDVRDVSHLLHPSIIRVGLLPALRALARRFEERFRIVVRADAAVHQMDSTDNSQIPEKVRLACYRVIEEALANAACHGAAATVLITLTLSAVGRLEFTVEDDGIGFVSSESQPGFGFRIIEAYLARVNGAADIVSQPGVGTVVRGWLPLSVPVAMPAIGTGEDVVSEGGLKTHAVGLLGCNVLMGEPLGN